MALSTFGIVLLPDEATTRHVRNLSESLGENKINPGFHVHLSLLHLMLDESRLPLIQEFVDHLPAQGNTSVICNELLEQNGWHFLEARKTAKLLHLQKSVLPLADLRDGNTNFSWRAHASISQKRAHAKYGYPNVGTAWPPHFTFGKTTVSKPEAVLLPTRWQGNIQALAIGRVGEYGTLTELFHIRKLFS